MTTSPKIGAAPSAASTALRQAEKYFKSRSHGQPGGELTHKQHRLAKKQVGKPSLRGRGIVDLSRRGNGLEDEVVRAGWEVDNEENGGRRLRRLGLKKVTGQGSNEGYVLAEGIILIPCYLDQDEQLELLCAALETHTRPPNPLSLDTHYAVPKSPSTASLFDMYADGSEQRIPSLAELEEARVQAATAQGSCRSNLPSSGRNANLSSLTASASRQLINNPAAVQEGFLAIQRRLAGWKGDEPSPNLKGATAADLMRELRWCNLGLVYNWTNKAYDFTRTEPIPFPRSLAETCTRIIRSVPWHDALDLSQYGDQDDQLDCDRWASDYAPDTGIVNYYQLKDTLMGHVDRSELDPYRPLVSISLGHAVIFLLGGSDRDGEPIPVILRSGDVLIMAGKGRRRYHGVPRVMEGTLPDHFLPVDTDDRVMTACKRFISTARININARQVFPAGFTTQQ